MKKILIALIVAAATVSFVAAEPASAARKQGGYWMLTSDGQAYGFGGAADLGSPPTTAGSVHLTPTKSGNGYWILNQTGAVHAFGDAAVLGSGPAPATSDERYTTMAATPTGGGYWLFTNKGRVAPFGDAVFFGDMTGVRLNGPVLDAVATPTGRGYYMVGSDGGVFSFGDAAFHGSTGNIKLNKPVMSLAPDADGAGYWLVASDGGIFAFEAPFYGSTGNISLNKPISGIVASPTGGGYLMVAQDGGVFSFGDVPFYGSLGSDPPWYPVVSIAAIGDPVPPAAQTFTGTGKTVTASFPIVGGLTSFTVTNQGSSNFAIWLLNATTGAREDLLVNEIGAFSGTNQIGVKQGNYVMDITGGNWKVVINQPLYGSGRPVPTNFSGRGMTATGPMLVLTQSLVRFQMHHDGSSNFAIWLLDADGNHEDLLVNEIGAFNGSKGIPLAPGVYVMQVEADGNWSVGIS